MAYKRFCKYKVAPVTIVTTTVFLFIFVLYSGSRRIDEHLRKNARNIDYSVDNKYKDVEIRNKQTVVQKNGSHVESNDGLHVSKDNQGHNLCPRIHFVFIKCMKCATETMGTILRRFAWKNQLNVMLPNNNNIYFGWPYHIDRVDYQPSDTKYYDCLIEHSIYNATIMRPLFHPNAKYISIIREPWKQFMSAFKYFNVQKIAQIKSNSPLSEYLQNIDKFESVYKSTEASTYRYCIPDGFSVTKNLMSHCLGAPTGFPLGQRDITHNNKLVKQYIDTLADEFDLVLIVEYFHESLILLKRLMCWDLSEIIYKRTNSDVKYSYTSSTKDKLIHGQWSSMDYMLYNFFNKTLWKKIEQQKSFFEEVQVFTHIQNGVNKFCAFSNSSETVTPLSSVNVSYTTDTMIISKTKFNERFTYTKENCDTLNNKLLPELVKQYDSRMKLKNRPKYNSKVKRTC